MPQVQVRFHHVDLRERKNSNPGVGISPPRSRKRQKTVVVVIAKVVEQTVVEYRSLVVQIATLTVQVIVVVDCWWECGVWCCECGVR